MKNLKPAVLTLFSAALCVAAIPSFAKEHKKHVILTKKPIEQFDKIYFPKIKDYKANLECISLERYFTAGDFAKLTFRLHNVDSKPLVVYEWLERSPDNLRLYFYKMKEGEQAPPPLRKFTPLIPDVGKKPKRMTLELQPRNAVLVDKLLPFIRLLDVKKPTAFLVFATLNLRSISARSGIIKIFVLPRGKTH